MDSLSTQTLNRDRMPGTAQLSHTGHKIRDQAAPGRYGDPPRGSQNRFAMDSRSARTIIKF
jgi:hypothetical protein